MFWYLVWVFFFASAIFQENYFFSIFCITCVILSSLDGYTLFASFYFKLFPLKLNTGLWVKTFFFCQIKLNIDYNKLDFCVGVLYERGLRGGMCLHEEFLQRGVCPW